MKDWKLLAVGIPAAIIMLPVIVAGLGYQCIAAYFIAGRELGKVLHKGMIKALEAK